MPASERQGKERERDEKKQQTELSDGKKITNILIIIARASLTDFLFLSLPFIFFSTYIVLSTAAARYCWCCSYRKGGFFRFCLSIRTHYDTLAVGCYTRLVLSDVCIHICLLSYFCHFFLRLQLLLHLHLLSFLLVAFFSLSFSVFICDRKWMAQFVIFPFEICFWVLPTQNLLNFPFK